MDSVHGDADDDSVRCDAGDDVACEGNDGDDVVWCGKGDDVCEGNADDDILLTQDLTTDTTVAGGAGSDTCFLDDGTASTDDTSSSCTDVNMSPCAFGLFVGTDDGTGAVLNGLLPDGSLVANGYLVSGAMMYDSVAGLAIDPTSCTTLFAVLNYTVMKSPMQDLVTVNLATQPGVDGDFDVTVVGTWSTNPMADIAFGARGTLLGLQVNANLVQINTSTGGRTVLDSVGHGSSVTGLNLAFDHPDSGMMFVVTSPDAGWFDVDAWDPVTEMVRKVEHHVDWKDPEPFTFTPVGGGDAGQILVIDQGTGGCKTGFPMSTWVRQNWGGVVNGSAVDDNRVDWTVGCGGSQCCAEIDDPPDAITQPFWSE
jgi:hypothetical protein